MIKDFKFFKKYNTDSINESVIYFGPDVKDFLERERETGDVISKSLLEISGKEIEEDITFISVDRSTAGMVNFHKFKDVQDSILKSTNFKLEPDTKLTGN